MALTEKTENIADPVAVEYHADDYGLFPSQAMRILDCHYRGKLNGVSVMPNGKDLEVSMELLAQAGEEIAVTIHLNLIEGRCLSTPAPELGVTDPEGKLTMTFGGLLLRSILPGKNGLKNWLKQELRAQIAAVAAFLPADQPLRLDGHAHYHMIPVVFDALMDVIREDGRNISYIRIPREHPMLYLRHFGRIRDFAPINLAKVLILNLLAGRNERKYAAYLGGLEQKIFLGVFLSGRMYRENVEPILPDALALAGKRGWGLEILAHPGGVEEPENIARLTNKEDIAFLTDPLRRREATLFRK